MAPPIRAWPASRLIARLFVTFKISRRPPPHRSRGPFAATVSDELRVAHRTHPAAYDPASSGKSPSRTSGRFMCAGATLPTVSTFNGGFDVHANGRGRRHACRCSSRARRPRRRRGPFSRRVASPRRHHLSSRCRKLIANSSTSKGAAMRPFTSGLAGANYPRTLSLHQKIPPPSRLAPCAPRVLIASRIAMKLEIRWLAHPALAR